MQVIFDQLRVSDDGQKMFIDIHVNTLPVFSNVRLDKIYVATADNVQESTSCPPPEDKCIYVHTFGEDETEAHIKLPSENGYTYEKGNFSSDLFLVYVTCKTVGDPDVCYEYLPCEYKQVTVGVTFDENLLYQKVMSYTKELADSCSVHQDFADFILQWNAFKASVETEHWISAKKFYNLMFSKGTSGDSITKHCGCHG